MRVFPLLLAIFLVILSAVAPAEKSSPEAKGRFLDKGTYNNPSLRMTLKLPGAWEFFTDQTKKAMGVDEKDTVDPSCTGPLCRSDVDVSLITKAEPIATASIYLLAYKLAPNILIASGIP